MKSVKVVRHAQTQRQNDRDWLAFEQPLNIDVVYGKALCRTETRLTMTMRTPGHDHELAVGLLFSLAIIKNYQNIIRIVPCMRNILDPNAIDQITIFLDEKIVFSPLGKALGHPRYSSCGICGSHDLLPLTRTNNSGDFFSVAASLLYTLPQKMKEQQAIFLKTGGTHAAALFSKTGILTAIFEDVGRHNALDKLIGHLLINDAAPWGESILILSSRASYEIIEKAARAGITVVVVMGAVSSVAVELAQFYSMTLVGFLRADRLNVYSHDERIA